MLSQKEDILKQLKTKITGLTRGFTKAQLEFNAPKRLRSYTFDSFLPSEYNKDNLDICLQFAENFGDISSLIMLGNVGTGKTHLAVAICNMLIAKDVSCKYSTAGSIIKAHRESWGIGENYDDMVKYGLLVIDEAGAQYGTDSEKIILSDIISERYDELKPTIVIGNASGKELKAVIGERAIDRLMHNGKSLVFKGETMRIRK